MATTWNCLILCILAIYLSISCGVAYQFDDRVSLLESLRELVPVEEDHVTSNSLDDHKESAARLVGSSLTNAEDDSTSELLRIMSYLQSRSDAMEVSSRSGPPKDMRSLSVGPPKLVSQQRSGPPKSTISRSVDPPKINNQERSGPPKDSISRSVGPPKQELFGQRSGPPKSTISRSVDPPKLNNQERSGPPKAMLSLVGDPPKLEVADRSGPPKLVDVARSGPPKSNSPLQNIQLELLRLLRSGPPKRALGSRDPREDIYINFNSRRGGFPWDEECAKGYTHCEGYFPLCCEGYVCLKPLTVWDKRNGFKRCWPDYFQTTNESDDVTDNNTT